jgi:hypothetical protein
MESGGVAPLTSSAAPDEHGSLAPLARIGQESEFVAETI